jgi:hypothetical protein
LVEQRIENPRVGGSIPPLATTPLAVPFALANATARPPDACDALQRIVDRINPTYRS